MVDIDELASCLFRLDMARSTQDDEDRIVDLGRMAVDELRALRAEVARLRGLCGEAAEVARCLGTCGGCARCRLATRLRNAAKGGEHG